MDVNRYRAWQQGPILRQTTAAGSVSLRHHERDPGPGNGSITALRRCYWLFNGGMAMLFRIKDGHLWTWMSFLYFLRCLFGRFVCSKSGLKLSIDCHIKLLDEGALARIGAASVCLFSGGGRVPPLENFRCLCPAISANPPRPRASPLARADF
jgi:hypothetical protein